jgi:hypothetical protein
LIIYSSSVPGVFLGEKSLELVLDAELSKLFSDLASDFSEPLSGLHGDLLGLIDTAVKVLLSILGWLLIVELLIRSLMRNLPAVILGG